MTFEKIFSISNGIFAVLLTAVLIFDQFLYFKAGEFLTWWTFTPIDALWMVPLIFSWKNALKGDPKTKSFKFWTVGAYFAMLGYLFIMYIL